MKIDFAASMPHFIDHLAPVYKALHDLTGGASCGKFYTSAALVPYARDRGVEASRATSEFTHLKTPVAVAASGDLRRTRSRHVVYFEHGTGQSYGNDHPSYIGGRARDGVRLFLMPSTESAERNKKVYGHVPHVVCGSPRLDAIVTRKYVKNPSPRIAISFHWDCQVAPEARSAWPHFRHGVHLLKQAGFDLIGHGHPRIVETLAPWYKTLGIPVERNFDKIVEMADLYVVDNSSTMYEFAASGKPVVVLNAPWFRRTVDLPPRFWKYADIGINCDDSESLVSAVEEALKDPKPVARRRNEVVRAVYDHIDGSASARAAAAIEEWLLSLRST